MGRKMTVMVIALCVGLCVPCSWGSDSTPTGGDEEPGVVGTVYRGLTYGGLTYAKLADLPGGTVLRAGELTLTERDVRDELDTAYGSRRKELQRNGFLVLERVATEKLLAREARAEAARRETKPPTGSDREIVRKYLEEVAKKAEVEVTDEDVRTFYEANQSMFRRATLDQVKPYLTRYVREQKQQGAVADHMRQLGRRTEIEVSALWTKRQAALAMDNPLDRARASGRPSLVVFSAGSCCGPDKMLPVVKAIKEEHAGTVNVVPVDPRREGVLAQRHNVRSIPTVIFYGADGREIARQTGFMSQEQIESKLAELGVD